MREMPNGATKSPATADEFLASLDRMGIYVNPQGHRAVHKPLLVLMALAHVQRGQGTKLAFNEIESQLQSLIGEFGSATGRSAARAHYPFWYLKTDGFWFVEDAAELTLREGKPEPRVTSLRERNTVAGFVEPVAALLRSSPQLITEAAARVLQRAFPETRFIDVLDAVGLEVAIPVLATKRDANFRRMVLRAYNASCAVCRFGGRLGLQPVGIEAAHVKWVQFGGPNSIANGLALCSLHHKLFDIGVFTVRPVEFNVAVSSDFDGDGAAVTELLTLARARSRICNPHRPEEALASEFLEWHNSEVFVHK